MTKKPFNALNDCFVRYFFTDKGGEKVLLDFINAVMISADMKTFKAVEILNPFNLKRNYKDKETIVDVKCITKNGTVVIIEVQLSGNSRFPERILCSGSYRNISDRVVKKVMDYRKKTNRGAFSDNEAYENIIFAYYGANSAIIYRQWVADGKKLSLEEVKELAIKLVCNGLESIMKP